MFSRSRSAFIGVVGTGLYLLLLTYIVVSGWTDFADLKPNEWGDFLAGSFGPLALFWLILSFFQQSQELQHSVSALKLQAEELKNSAEQQRELVEVTKNALDHDRLVISLQYERELENIKPKFICDQQPDRTFSVSSVIYLRLTNIGGPAFNVSAYGENIAHWASGEARDFQNLPSMDLNFHSTREISFEDARRNKHTQRVTQIR